MRFIVYGGFWNFSYISLKVAEEPFFSPDEITALIPNELRYNELLTFRAEYLDINNNSVGVETIANPLHFVGARKYVLLSEYTTGSSGTVGPGTPNYIAKFGPSGSTVVDSNIVNPIALPSGSEWLRATSPSSSAWTPLTLDVYTGVSGSGTTTYTGSFTGSFSGSFYPPPAASVGPGSQPYLAAFDLAGTNVVNSDIESYSGSSFSIYGPGTIATRSYYEMVYDNPDYSYIGGRFSNVAIEASSPRDPTIGGFFDFVAIGEDSWARLKSDYWVELRSRTIRLGDSAFVVPSSITNLYTTGSYPIMTLTSAPSLNLNLAGLTLGMFGYSHAIPDYYTDHLADMRAGIKFKSLDIGKKGTSVSIVATESGSSSTFEVELPTSPPTKGQILYATSPSSSAWSSIYPYGRPENANENNEEWITGSLPGWTVDQTPSSPNHYDVHENDNFHLIVHIESGSGDILQLSKTLSGTWTGDISATMDIGMGTFDNYASIEFGFLTAGLNAGIFVDINNNGYVYLRDYSNWLTDTSSNLVTSKKVFSTTEFHPFVGYFHMQRVSGEWSYWVSPDCLTWGQLGANSTAYTVVGVGIRFEGGGAGGPAKKFTFSSNFIRFNWLYL